MPVEDVEKLAHELQMCQAEFAHVSRLSLMGEMAPGLAHELNQPLTAIILNIRACMRRIRSGAFSAGELLDDMEQACSQADRAQRIIHFLRDFARKGEPKAAAVDINDIVREAAGLAGAETRQKEISVRFELAGHLPPLWADRVQIQQVVLNLVRNAVEAMDDGDAGERELSIRTAKAGSEHIEVAIRDTGKGIPADTLEQVFDAFFTTKIDGMGMGLAISRSIVEAHGGRLWAMPNRDRGTTFRFNLPTTKGGAPDAVQTDRLRGGRRSSGTPCNTTAP